MYKLVDRKATTPEFLSKNVVLKLENLSMTKGQGHNCSDRKVVKPKIELIMDQKDVPQTVMRRVLDTLKGQSVIARRETDGLYYPGVVQKCPDTRHAFVEFADKEQVVVPTRLIIATSGAIARPQLRIGDCVLVRVINADSKLDCYAPGIVQVTPVHEEAQAKFYTVIMYNGQQATTMRNSIMKISKSRFEFAIRYIAEIQAEDQDRIDDNVYVQTPRSDRSSDQRRRGRKSNRDRHRHRKRTPSPDVPLEIPEDDQLMPLQSSFDKTSNYGRPMSSRPEAPTPNTARTGRTLTPVLESVHSPRSRSRSKSPGDNRSRSKSPKSARSRSKSPNSARSRSKSNSRSRSRSATPRSRSNSDDRKDRSSRSQSRSRSRSRSRSHSRSSKSRSRSRSRSKESSRSRSRSPSLDLKNRSESMERVAKKSKKLKQLKKQLKEQQEEHDRQQYKIQKQAKKLQKLKKKLKKKKKKEYSYSKVGSHTVMVEVESSDDSSTEGIGKRSRDRPESASTTTAPIVAPALLHLRKSLPPLREGEEVLARWSDEGWYFRGIVKQDCGDYSYIIEDSTRMCERIWREDIITDYDDANHIIQPKDPVVALHPHYSFSYAPGVALEVYHNLEMKIRFYDGEESRLTREDIFKLSPEKFDHDVNFIIECETRWVNQAVVARNDQTGTYHLASIKERVGNGREYIVEWCDGDQATQTSHHIFGVFTKHHPLSVGDHVLAMWDSQQHVYLPGWVAGIVGNKINIKFCDGSIRDVDDMLQCFWLSSDYYENAVMLYKKCLEEDSA